MYKKINSIMTICFIAFIILALLLEKQYQYHYENLIEYPIERKSTLVVVLYILGFGGLMIHYNNYLKSFKDETPTEFILLCFIPFIVVIISVLFVLRLFDSSNEYQNLKIFIILFGSIGTLMHYQFFLEQFYKRKK